MEQYNDFAINPENFEKMAKEFNLQKSNVLTVKNSSISNEQKMELKRKLRELAFIVKNLAKYTNITAVVEVINNIDESIKKEYDNLLPIFEDVVEKESEDEQNYKMFCNGLKLSINIVAEIIKLLIEIKDSDDSFQYSTVLTNSINNFLDINNQLVSLFGECRYRTFGLFNK